MIVVFLLRLALLCAALLTGAANAQDVRPIPPLSGRVVDQTGTLSGAQFTALSDKLAAFEAQAGPQIVVLIVPTVQPEDIVDYTQRVGDAWKLGRRDVGDGVLIVVAKNDRRVRIAPAKALEGAVPDLAARQIIQDAITPAFKQNDYAGGLNRAVDQLEARLRGESLPAPTRAHAQRTQHGLDWQTLAMVFFIGVPLIGVVLTAVMGRKLGGLTTSLGAGALGWTLGGGLLFGALAAVVALVLISVMGIGAARRSGLGSGLGRGYSGGNGSYVPPVVWGGGGSSSSGGFGGGGGGGFSSGGGGDFGGGGASGDW